MTNPVASLAAPDYDRLLAEWLDFYFCDDCDYVGAKAYSHNPKHHVHHLGYSMGDRKEISERARAVLATLLARGVQYAPRESEPVEARKEVHNAIDANLDQIMRHARARLDNPEIATHRALIHDAVRVYRDALWVRGRPEGPACHGPNSHAEYNSLVATAEALADENDRLRGPLEAVLRMLDAKAPDEHLIPSAVAWVREQVRAAYAVDFGEPEGPFPTRPAHLSGCASEVGQSCNCGSP